MPRKSPYLISLSRLEERSLRERTKKYSLPYSKILRAKMILFAAEGQSNEAIALLLGTRREVVSLWRKRFYLQRLAGLEDRRRSGRPRIDSKTPSRLHPAD